MANNDASGLVTSFKHFGTTLHYTDDMLSEQNHIGLEKETDISLGNSMYRMLVHKPDVHVVEIPLQ